MFRWRSDVFNPSLLSAMRAGSMHPWEGAITPVQWRGCTFNSLWCTFREREENGTFCAVSVNKIIITIQQKHTYSLNDNLASCQNDALLYGEENGKLRHLSAEFTGLNWGGKPTKKLFPFIRFQFFLSWGYFAMFLCTESFGSDVR